MAGGIHFCEWKEVFMRNFMILATAIWLAAIPLPAGTEDAAELVQAAVDYYRGEASRARVRMVIHRPEWQREMILKAWTEGRKKSLFYILEPAKDKGNGTLKRGSEMWTYNPKVNRVIKLPPSMMSQPWMGSDFSNNDLAKSDSIVEDYTHSLERTYTMDAKRVHVIRCLPKPAAPVVWGMQKLHIREDWILLREEFYDEDHRRVKTMTGSRIETLGGKLFPKVWKMQKEDALEEYTLLEYRQLEFLEDLPDRMFTVSALRNPGR
jgi:outer membrane lipoprotein-sorting protein